MLYILTSTICIVIGIVSANANYSSTDDWRILVAGFCIGVGAMGWAQIIGREL